VSLIGLEGGWRAWRRSPPAASAERLEALLLLVLIVTVAGGLGLLLGGGQPREVLHFVYAVVALGVLPVVASLSRRAGPRARGIALFTAAQITLAVIARLFQTG
jgi:hypothetical protein